VREAEVEAVRADLDTARAGRGPGLAWVAAEWAAPGVAAARVVEVPGDQGQVRAAVPACGKPEAVVAEAVVAEAVEQALAEEAEAAAAVWVVERVWAVEPAGDLVVGQEPGVEEPGPAVEELAVEREAAEELGLEEVVLVAGPAVAAEPAVVDLVVEQEAAEEPGLEEVVLAAGPAVADLAVGREAAGSGLGALEAEEEPGPAAEVQATPERREDG
jgi:hypothetical protein